MQIPHARRVLSTALCVALSFGLECAPAIARDNPLLKTSPLPFQFPVFDQLQENDFRDGFERGMAEQRQEISAIANSTEPATFDNTIVALERSGVLINRVGTLFGNLTSANTNPEHDAIDSDMSPRLAEHQDSIYLNAALFGRIDTLYQKRQRLGLDPESLRLLERYHTNFVRNGAALDDARKKELMALNQKMASINTEYDHVLLKANADSVVVVDKEQDLAGFSAEQIAAAAQAAKARHLDGKWVIALQRPTSQDALGSLDNRAVRERVFKAAATRGLHGTNDTTHLLTNIARLRAHKAALLGYKDWASYVLADVSAGTPEAVNAMLGQIGPAALRNVRKTAESLQKLADADARAQGKPTFRLAAWDWAYYSEKWRKQQYSYDESAIRPYFELNRVLTDGVFYAAEHLYGLSFREHHDLPVYDPDVRVFEVLDRDHSTLAYILFDFYARPNKQGGAWMNEYVSQSGLLGTHPVVANHLNYSHPAPGQPALLNYDEVRTLFHEFGHALHGMLSDVRYPMFGGTNGSPPDFVEYPSQFNEMWAQDPAVLAHMAHHYQTNAALPVVMLDKVRAANLFQQGFVTSEYVAAAMLDQAWHQIPEQQIPDPAQVESFEAGALKKAGMNDTLVPPRYRTTYFSHIFGASSGYSAQYYGYLWSDVLARDTESWMKSHGGLQRANGDFLRAKVLSRGSSDDQQTLFRQFYGTAPDAAPLLQARGLPVPRTGPDASATH